jgi:hypothetical protein
MLGFASTVMASWEVLLVLFKLTLLTGGFPNLFWGFIVNVCGMLFVYASIAELASMCVTNLVTERESHPDNVPGRPQLVDSITGFPSLLQRACRSR